MIAKEKTKTKTKTKKVANDRYTEAVGRRKTAVARVRIFPAGKTTWMINGKTLEQYFSTGELQQMARAPLLSLNPAVTVRSEVKVTGSGIVSQAGAVAHGLARALIKEDAARRPILKKALLLRRDPRMKERRKFGLKKARKAPQWSKR
ncbi:MAG: 30S ribosomal protein S9 [Patescibacteria group bacterium]